MHYISKFFNILMIILSMIKHILKTLAYLRLLTLNIGVHIQSVP